ncbi:hypothetical protein EJ08DRAFT_680692 [Tothia fuscella]|uniref:Uncharacterized protein n=1 Tax=Tothia fuscella TaxID=1048955 RepID=A0A9P4TX18_9PEZI|nr:hypothetical protein EJ08DRAFT_680692 [Tothia fuscella]
MSRRISPLHTGCNAHDSTSTVDSFAGYFRFITLAAEYRKYEGLHLYASVLASPSTCPIERQAFFLHNLDQILIEFGVRSASTANNLFLLNDRERVVVAPKALSASSRKGVYSISPYKDTLGFVAADSYHTQLGLQIRKGDQGFHSLILLFEPTENSIPKDTPTEWSVFQIGNGGVITVKDGIDIPTRKWILYGSNGGDRVVGLWDGTTPQSKQFENITLIATPFEG